MTTGQPTHPEPSATGGRLLRRSGTDSPSTDSPSTDSPGTDPAGTGPSGTDPADTGPDRIAVIGLAHGSRHPGVTGPIEALMSAAGELTGVPARAAYLDLTDPDLTAVAIELAAAGVRRVVVVPLLFTNAFHARVDVPSSVAEAATASGVELVTGDILGTGEDVEQVLAAAIGETGAPVELPVLVYAVGSSDASANTAVQDLALRLGDHRGSAALAAFGTTDPRREQVLAELAPDGPVVVAPLFVSPGLLLDPLAQLARDRGWPLTAPLGARLAPVVAARYASAVAALPPLGR